MSDSRNSNTILLGLIHIAIPLIAIFIQMITEIESRHLMAIAIGTSLGVFSLQIPLYWQKLRGKITEISRLAELESDVSDYIQRETDTVVRHEAYRSRNALLDQLKIISDGHVRYSVLDGPDLIHNSISSARLNVHTLFNVHSAESLAMWDSSEMRTYLDMCKNTANELGIDNFVRVIRVHNFKLSEENKQQLEKVIRSNFKAGIRVYVALDGHNKYGELLGRDLVIIDESRVHVYDPPVQHTYYSGAQLRRYTEDDTFGAIWAKTKARAKLCSANNVAELMREIN